jgi:hypothetical protein
MTSRERSKLIEEEKYAKLVCIKWVP